MQVLYHYPEVVGSNFRKNSMPWTGSMTLRDFEKWQGKTGFPLVDAGMRELNATGYMHNRVRMIVAGFLCKDLLVDWRWGEAYFAQNCWTTNFLPTTAIGSGLPVPVMPFPISGYSTLRNNFASTIRSSFISANGSPNSAPRIIRLRWSTTKWPANDGCNARQFFA